MTSPSPVVGEWYRRFNGALFEVVAIDRDDGTVEVQHFDGTVEEFDLEAWEEMEFEEAQPPVHHRADQHELQHGGLLQVAGHATRAAPIGEAYDRGHRCDRTRQHQREVAELDAHDQHPARRLGEG